MEYDQRFIDFLDGISTRNNNGILESIKSQYIGLFEASSPDYVYSGITEELFNDFKQKNYVAKQLPVVSDAGTAMYDAIRLSRGKSKPYVLKLDGNAILDSGIRWKIVKEGTPDERAIGSGDFSHWIIDAKPVTDRSKAKATKQDTFGDLVTKKKQHKTRDKLIASLERDGDKNPYSKAAGGVLKMVRGVQNMFEKKDDDE